MGHPRQIAQKVIPPWFWNRLLTLRRRILTSQQLAFDRMHGVETTGIVDEPEMDDLDEQQRMAGRGYSYTPRTVFASMLGELNIDYQRFAFIDIGSGKGAVLLYASDFPFKKIIGVEHSPRIHQIAQENIRNYTSRTIKCKDITTVCMDAAEYQFPDDPLVIYLYNPFGIQQLLTRMLANLERSVRKCPREVLVVAISLRDEVGELEMTGRVLDGTEWLEQIRGGWKYAIYQSKNLPAEV